MGAASGGVEVEAPEVEGADAPNLRFGSQGLTAPSEGANLRLGLPAPPQDANLRHATAHDSLGRPAPLEAASCCWPKQDRGWVEKLRTKSDSYLFRLREVGR